MSAPAGGRGDAAAMTAGGLLGGILLAYLAFLVRLNRVSEGADTPGWYWAFLLNVAALVGGGAWCLLRRPRYRALGTALLLGFALSNLPLVVGAVRSGA